MQDDKGGMGNSLCKVPLQEVCPTNEGYTTEQPRGSFDHCKHKDELCNELCTLNIVHDSHAYNQQKGGCYVKFCPDTLHNYLCPQPEVNALSMFFLLTPVISYVLVVLGCQKKIPEPTRSTLQRL